MVLIISVLTDLFFPVLLFHSEKLSVTSPSAPTANRQVTHNDSPTEIKDSQYIHLVSDR